MATPVVAVTVAVLLLVTGAIVVAALIAVRATVAEALAKH